MDWSVFLAVFQCTSFLYLTLIYSAMKKILFSLSLLASVFVMSCKGPAGPPGFDGSPGPQGPEGPAGVNIAGSAFDVNVPVFNTANDFRVYFEFPQSVEVLESDAVLVYREWEKIADPNGGAPISVWRLLPQTIFLPNRGALQYNFDHTFTDASMFIDTQFDRNTLEAKYTTNQKFRVVIIPADFAANGRLGLPIDHNDYKAVSEFLHLDERQIKTYEPRK